MEINGDNSFLNTLFMYDCHIYGDFLSDNIVKINNHHHHNNHHRSPEYHKHNEKQKNTQPQPHSTKP